ncbi:MAG: enoyl-CoA hydratase/isomerase family protein [Candidatus Rokubacteria bacterium]|nr:enoyl-CoA hydratase/isomerase family protein [Candidatus Rokubacteria bacterium]
MSAVVSGSDVAGACLVTVAVEPPAAIIRINRPERLNALNRAVQDALTGALLAADADPRVRAIVLTGTGRAFSVGADIDELALSMTDALRQLEATLAFLSSPERLRKPVIAAVNGYALGGGLELALACDLVVASDTAVFAAPEPTLGVVPAFAMLRLPHLVGVSRARDILLTARRLTAADAKEIGLVARVVPPEALLAEAASVVADVARLAPLAVELLKSGINRTLAAGDLEFGARANAELFATRDAAEGVAAFREKRRPVFDGR